MRTVSEILDAIAVERKRQGIPIAELMKRAGIRQSSYYTWMEKKSAPSADGLFRLIDALGFEVRIRRKKEKTE